MAIFHQHSYCACFRENNKGKDPCVESKDTTSCKFCSAITPEQLAQISTPSYKIKKEKHEARKSVTATPTKDSSELVDPASVSVIGVVGHQDTTQQTEPVKSPSTSSMPRKRPRKKRSFLKPRSRLSLHLLIVRHLLIWTVSGPNVLIGLRPFCCLRPFNRPFLQKSS